MTLEGTVITGLIVLHPPRQLPEGAKVKVEVEVPDCAPNSLRDLLLEFAGSCPGLPPDMAEQHDRQKWAAGANKPSLTGLLELAGAVDDLPCDMARNHDHYLYGAPKR
jgi:hypothetical protein